MAATLSAEVMKDDLALSLARVLAAANKEARKAGVDLLQSLITITQQPAGNALIWRVNYGPKDYVGRRGGDLIVEVDPEDASVRQVLRGQ
jgi:hypothetical protein